MKMLVRAVTLLFAVMATALGVVVVSAAGVAVVSAATQEPEKPKVEAAAVKSLSAEQIQQAATLRAWSGEIDRDYSEKLTALETASAAFTKVKTDRDTLRTRVTQATPGFLKTLGGVEGDTFDWGTLTLKKAVKK